MPAAQVAEIRHMPHDNGRNPPLRLSFRAYGETDSISRVIAAAKKFGHVNQKIVPSPIEIFTAIKSFFVM
jgi:hypothetical protein